jgi:hypothetical protein
LGVAAYLRKACAAVSWISSLWGPASLPQQSWKLAAVAVASLSSSSSTAAALGSSPGGGYNSTAGRLSDVLVPRCPPPAIDITGLASSEHLTLSPLAGQVYGSAFTPVPLDALLLSVETLLSLYASSMLSQRSKSLLEQWKEASQKKSTSKEGNKRQKTKHGMEEDGSDDEDEISAMLGASSSSATKAKHPAAAAPGATAAMAAAARPLADALLCEACEFSTALNTVKDRLEVFLSTLEGLVVPAGPSSSGSAGAGATGLLSHKVISLLKAQVLPPVYEALKEVEEANRRVKVVAGEY